MTSVQCIVVTEDEVDIEEDIRFLIENKERGERGERGERERERERNNLIGIPIKVTISREYRENKNRYLFDTTFD